MVECRIQKDHPPLEGKSFGVLSPDNPIRKWLYSVITTQLFDNCMFFFIAISCVAMIYEHPGLKPGSLDTTILQWLEITLTIIFGAECLSKMIAFGFFPYLKRHSNKVRPELKQHTSQNRLSNPRANNKQDSFQ